MGAWLDRLALFWLDATVATALLLVVVTLMMVACHQPARRSALARGAILGSLALPALMGSAPIGRIEVTRHLGRFAPPVPPPDNERDVGPPPRSPWEKLPRVLVSVYAVGVLAGFSRLALGYWGLGRVLRAAREPSAASLALLDGLPGSRRRRPRLRVSDRVGQPAVVGLIRPTVLVPPALDDPGAAEALRLSLLHELAHADRLDLWFGLLAELARDLWFFLPPIWWLRAQMRLDQEFLADGGAAFRFGSSGGYASSLVALADPRPRSGAAPSKSPAPVPTGGVSALFQRILMLVRCPFPMEPRPPRWWLALMAPGLIALTVGFSAITLRRPSLNLDGAFSGPHTFRVPSLVIDPEPGGACTPHNLPLRLPHRFELTVELFADRGALGRIRVAGVPVASPCDDCQDRAEWHRVEIRRDRDRIELRLDDHPPSPARHDRPPPPWLSIDVPPGTRLPVRNLTVTW